MFFNLRSSITLGLFFSKKLLKSENIIVEIMKLQSKTEFFAYLIHIYTTLDTKVTTNGKEMFSTKSLQEGIASIAKFLFVNGL